MAISPCDVASKQRDLHEPKLANGVFESVDERVVDVIIVFLIPRSDKVEVPNDYPRAIDNRSCIDKLLKKGLGVAVIKGTVNVGDVERVVGEGAVKRGCSGVSFLSGTRKAPKEGVPCSEHTRS